MRGCSLSGQVITLLEAYPNQKFATVSACAAHLTWLGIGMHAVTPDPCNSLAKARYRVRSATMACY